jgi:hypothetical protein
MIPEEGQKRPAPLVPGETDLRGMEFMPLLGDRLFKSTTWIEASSEARVAALRLWWHAYAHEVPAGSLPDNDLLLAEHAGYGNALKAWRKVRPQTMRGWILCGDGRWYHPLLAELALAAWTGRVRNREKIRKFRARKAAANSAVAEAVTVTEPVGNGREGESQGQGESQGERAEDEAAAALLAWQAAAALNGWPSADFLSTTRRWSLRQRLAECGGLAGWAVALERAADAQFLRGQRWFDLDWMLKPENFTRLMEGRYAERHRPAGHDDARSLAAGLAGLAEASSG